MLLVVLVLGAPGGAARAQLLEPLRPVLEPVLQPVLEPVLQPVREIVTGVTGPGATVLQPLAAEARQLLSRHPDQLETDRRGLPIMRAVIVALSPDPDALARAIERGYSVQDDQQLEGIDQRLVTLLVPRGTATREALRELREADPQGQYDFDHLYMESGAPSATAANTAAVANVEQVDIRVGLIDGGVDAAHPVFLRRKPTVSGCAGSVQPSAHGTAVASLFVGWSADFAGAAPGAELLAVDVYCGGNAPGGRMRDVVGALSALAAARSRVINMSIVGPDNAVLAATVRAVQARSVLIVAATGNDGPNAKPLFPAAYPGVVAVSAVDAKLRVLPEASGGEHVSFSAPGADLLAAAPDGKFQNVRGTSFAAPLVAGMLARELASDDSDTGAIVRRLAAAAEDRGRKGRDQRYGFGLVGADLPQRGLMARPAP
jgi:subtilisin family serine protease